MTRASGLKWVAYQGLVAVASLILSGSAVAGEPEPTASRKKVDEILDSPKSKSVFSIDSVFKLKPGVHPTEEQQAALDELREEYTPQLEAALQEVEKAKVPSEWSEAAKHIKTLRDAVRVRMNEILGIEDKPVPTRQKASEPPPQTRLQPEVMPPAPAPAAAVPARNPDNRRDDERERERKRERALDEKERKMADKERRLEQERDQLRRQQEAEARERRRLEAVQRQIEEERRKAAVKAPQKTSPPPPTDRGSAPKKKSGNGSKKHNNSPEKKSEKREPDRGADPRKKSKGK